MRITNRKFAKENQLFLKCIELAGIEKREKLTLKRQASKFRMGRGVANKFRATANRQMGRN